MTEISIIIPTYNRSNYLKRAINSVMVQEYSNFEILVCDNGSNDDSKSLCETFCDSRIHWIDGSKEIKHPGAMRNLGLKSANGQILCFLDSDDYWFSSHLNQIRRYLNKYSAIAQFFPNRKKRDHFIANVSKLSYRNSVITSSVAIKKSLLSEINYMPYSDGYKIYEDYAYWLRVSLITDFYLYSCRSIHYNATTSDSIRNNVVSNIENLLNVYQDLESWAETNNIKLPIGYYSSKKLALARAGISFVKNKFFYQYS